MLHGSVTRSPQLLLISCILVGACGPASSQEPLAPVTVAVAETGPMYAEVALTGSVVARRVSELSPKVDGLVAEILVDDGDTVAAGDVIVRLDDELARIGLARDQAARAEAEARLEEARRRRDEAAELVARKHVAQTVYQEALADVEISEAALERLRAEYRYQQEIVDRHVVRAPFDAVVGDKLTEVGEWVQTGTPLARLVEIDVLRIDVPVPQQYFGQVAAGSRVAVRFDALPDELFEARVTTKVPLSNPSARTFRIRIEIDNRDRLKAPGMSARVTLMLGGSSTQAHALQLPRDAILRSPDGHERVWVIAEEDGIASVHAVPVRTGRAAHGKVEILGDALRAGERVVVKGNENLRPGQQVRIVDTSAAEAR